MPFLTLYLFNNKRSVSVGDSVPYERLSEYVDGGRILTILFVALSSVSFRTLWSIPMHGELLR
ncbi:hypothetical protein Avbf_13556 [Armadillidium vulgare]|nr:hypothetical protein Avbf_13556 [Armadillidium vulgare]